MLTVCSREEQERLAEGKKKDMNLDPEYWKRKFLFPYANAGVNLAQYQNVAAAQLGSAE